jgi:hypothetical protein
MTGSIFDPSSGSVEQSGSTFTPPAAEQGAFTPDSIANPPTSLPAGTVGFQAPSEKRGIEVNAENDGKFLVVRLTGKLHKSDYQHFVPPVEQAVQKHGKVRIIVVMQNFHGWDAGALWEDIKFDVKHFNHIEKLAVVGEKTWEKWMVAFCKPFTTATIKYFSIERQADARAWVTA